MTAEAKRVRETAEQKLLRLTQIEAGLWNEGLRVAGIDEVGRGPLAGPVVTACVSIPRDRLVPGVDDSKKLSEKKRESLYPLLLDDAVTCVVGGDAARHYIECDFLETGSRPVARGRGGDGVLKHVHELRDGEVI